jgi:Ca-activated chloride channel family protein
VDWLWADALLLLGCIPLLIATYLWILRRRCRFAVRYSNLSLPRAAVSQPSALRRHLPFIFFTLALTCLILATGRPITAETVLSGGTTIMLTLDVSRSMCMRDIQPYRLDAARQVARSFVQHPVLGTQIGIVAFAGFAELAQRPTKDGSQLESALQSLSTATNTAIGSGILRSLDAIADVDQRVARSEAIAESSSDAPQDIPRLQRSEEDYMPHIIVLLTDGESNSGPHPLLAALQAAKRGIRIYTIGFGTTRNAVMDCWNTTGEVTPRNPGLESLRGGGSFGSGPDEATLKQIAEMTGGKFYSATSAEELQMVFQELGGFIAMDNKTIEVSVFPAAAGALLVMAAFILSLFRHPFL